MAGTTTRLGGLPYPNNSDPANVPSDILALANKLDVNAAGWYVNTSSVAPTSPYDGQFWYQTDKQRLQLRYSGVWYNIGQHQAWAAFTQTNSIIKVSTLNGGALVDTTNVMGIVPVATGDGTQASSGEGIITPNASGWFNIGLTGRYQINYSIAVSNSAAYAATEHANVCLLKQTNNTGTWAVQRGGSSLYIGAPSGIAFASRGTALLSLTANDNITLGCMRFNSGSGTFTFANLSNGRVGTALEVFYVGA
jgi:hypothetical protein